VNEIRMTTRMKMTPEVMKMAPVVVMMMAPVVVMARQQVMGE
jgi:hypothetical protein